MALQGEYIRHLRQAAGLTQIELAEALGFDNAGMVGHWEAGRLWVAPHHFAHLAEALGTDEAALMFRLIVYRNLGLAGLAQRTPEQIVKHVRDSKVVARRVERRRNLTRTNNEDG